jgi:hypothetical protein
MCDTCSIGTTVIAAAQVLELKRMMELEKCKEGGSSAEI